MNHMKHGWVPIADTSYKLYSTLLEGGYVGDYVGEYYKRFLRGGILGVWTIVHMPTPESPFLTTAPSAFSRRLEDHWIYAGILQIITLRVQALACSGFSYL